MWLTRTACALNRFAASRRSEEPNPFTSPTIKPTRGPATRSAVADGAPERVPASTSACLTQASSVCATQPIFGAMDLIAAGDDGYSPRCFCTISTARSRTSSENFFDFFIAPSFQEVEPPQRNWGGSMGWLIACQSKLNPGR